MHSLREVTPVLNSALHTRGVELSSVHSQLQQCLHGSATLPYSTHCVDHPGAANKQTSRLYQERNPCHPAYSQTAI